MIFDALQRNQCFITDESITGQAYNYPLLRNGYLVKVRDQQIMIQYDLEALYNESQKSEFQDFIKKHRHIFRGLMYNGLWLSKDANSQTLINREVLESLLSSRSYPKTPAEKKEKVFLSLCNMSQWDGQLIRISGLREYLAKVNYLFNEEELDFYLFTLVEEGLIEATSIVGHSQIHAYKLAYKGVSYYIQLTEEGSYSKRCFVAMSFDQEDEVLFTAIRDACYVAGGYEAFLVKDEHLDSHQTINDGIIAGIKKSKFVIADFTKQKDGVYFEAGYAVGRGLKVIYTCRKDWWNQTHFDTNHFPHIIYETPEELKQGLINKIQAWID